ncbi:MAG: hypothetical protein C5B59_12410 [Bacteroidetes bacterium]|nr:MAG: hypothetical protein C5B59_12410 [Bacteroidota bacterium]
MKKEEIPHDLGALGKITKEVCYVVDESGKYTTQLSEGWKVKAEALDVAWEDVQARIAVAREKVLAGEASPILLFMEYRLMDVGIVSAYTGFWKWTIKRHMKPDVFKRLSDDKLKKYAMAFETSVEDLKNMNVHEA